jgi:hypothetical protein
MKDDALKLALEAAYFAGFNASGEGYNGEYPFGDHVQDPEEDAAWRKNRDNELTAIKQALAAQPAPVQPVKPSLWEQYHAAQRQWVGLTDDERLEAAEIDGADEWFWKVCKAIEAKLKEKNNG